MDHILKAKKLHRFYRYKIVTHMPMEKKKRRICDYCGLLTDEEYTDEEWNSVGHECQDCIDAELVDGTIDE